MMVHSSRQSYEKEDHETQRKGFILFERRMEFVRSPNDADVYNRRLNTFDHAWLVGDSPADLSLGKSGYEMGYSFQL